MISGNYNYGVFVVPTTETTVYSDTRQFGNLNWRVCKLWVNAGGWDAISPQVYMHHLCLVIDSEKEGSSLSPKTTIYSFCCTVFLTSLFFPFVILITCYIYLSLSCFCCLIISIMSVFSYSLYSFQFLISSNTIFLPSLGIVPFIQTSLFCTAFLSSSFSFLCCFYFITCLLFSLTIFAT